MHGLMNLVGRFKCLLGRKDSVIQLGDFRDRKLPKPRFVRDALPIPIGSAANSVSAQYKFGEFSDAISVMV